MSPRRGDDGSRPPRRPGLPRHVAWIATRRDKPCNPLLPTTYVSYNRKTEATTSSASLNHDWQPAHRRLDALFRSISTAAPDQCTPDPGSRDSKPHANSQTPPVPAVVGVAVGFPNSLVLKCERRGMVEGMTRSCRLLRRHSSLHVPELPAGLPARFGSVGCVAITHALLLRSPGSTGSQRELTWGRVIDSAIFDCPLQLHALPATSICMGAACSPWASSFCQWQLAVTGPACRNYGNYSHRSILSGSGRVVHCYRSTGIATGGAVRCAAVQSSPQLRETQARHRR